MTPVELGYFAVPAADMDRARRFWSNLFGWQLAPPDANGYTDIDSTRMPGGLAPAPGETVGGWFRVEDIHAVVAQARRLGGSAQDPEHQPFGWTASCRDSQGVPFDLWQMEPGLFPPDRVGDPLAWNEPGYFVLPSPDPERGAAFFGPLFGWEFEPAAPNGYRHVKNIRIPGGLAVMPAGPVRLSFRVEDVAGIIAEVRASGGWPEDPTSSESGLSCSARDDQGVAFDLWQPAPGL